MAKSKNSGKERSQGIDSLDDIDLLNLYRYPEFFPEKLRLELKGSKSAIKRLEDLIKAENAPSPSPVYRKKTDKFVENRSAPAQKSEEQSSAPPEKAGTVNEILKSIRKLIP